MRVVFEPLVALTFSACCTSLVASLSRALQSCGGATRSQYEDAGYDNIKRWTRHFKWLVSGSYLPFLAAMPGSKTCHVKLPQARTDEPEEARQSN